jgi:hypothetical protein
MVIFNTLFAWLVDAGYLAGNPLSLSRQRARRAAPRVTRFLERDLWQEVKVYIDGLPRETYRRIARQIARADHQTCRSRVKPRTGVRLLLITHDLLTPSCRSVHLPFPCLR